MVEGWINEENLRPFLDTAFDFIDYVFDEADWQAVEYGIQETEVEQDKWFTYEMPVGPGLSVAVAHDDDNNSGVLFIQATSTPEVELKVAVIVGLMQNYYLHTTCR